VRAASWPLGAKLFRYVLAELVGPTGVALAGLVVVALTKDLLGYADLIVNRGLAAGAVAAIAAWRAVPIAAATLPFAVLIGALVGLGRLKADHELEAIVGAGIDPLRLLRPVLTLALAATAVALALSLLAAPAARRALGEALDLMAVEHPGAQLRPGTVHAFGDWQLLAREVSPDGAQLRGVLLWMPDLGETFFAERGDVEALGATRIGLTLHAASALTSPRLGGLGIQLERFHVELSEPPGTAGRDERLPSASLAELAELARGPRGGDPSPRLARAELERRFALPLATFVLALLVVPLALAGRRFSRSSGAVAGLLAVVGYYGLIQLADGLLLWESVPVALAVWLPDAVTAAVGLALLLRTRAASGRAPGRARGGLRAPRDEPGSAAASRPARSRRRPLDRYVLALYLRNAALCFAVLLASYLAIDVLERLQWFARHRAAPLEILRFYAARLPLLASRVAPMSLLAGSALTVSTLGLHGELVAMQACGIRLARGLAAILVASILFVPVDFALNDSVVPRSNALADRIKEEQIKDDPGSGGPKTSIWYRTGGLLLRAPRLGLELGSVSEVTIYELGPNGIPSGRIDAREAHHLGDGVWQLVDARRIAISERGLVEASPPASARLGEARAESSDAMHMSARELAREIRLAEAQHYSATAYRVDLHGRFAGPFACALLPAIALVQALAARRSPSVSRSLLASGVLGVGFILIGDVATSLGHGGWLPPALAGWSAPALCGGLAGFFAWRRGA
jgi:lipopolysaccharide export system permease protein